MASRVVAVEATLGEQRERCLLDLGVGGRLRAAAGRSSYDLLGHGVNLSLLAHFDTRCRKSWINCHECH